MLRRGEHAGTLHAGPLRTPVGDRRPRDLPIEAGAEPERHAAGLRSTWDYHRRWDEFRHWIAGFAPRNGRLWNPSTTVLWNADKWSLLEASGCLLQAFVPEIESRGEVSLIYLDQDFSHAIRKRPAPGDFRVQADFGGTLEAVTPPGNVRAFGEKVLATASRPWLYARVDLVETSNGPVLMELELIEPDPFLDTAASVRLAAALLANAGRAAA